MPQQTPQAPTRVSGPESQILAKYGIRWSILAAWRRELASRGVHFDAGIADRLDSSRVKLATGCFSSCEVGCELAAVERVLVSHSTTVCDGETDFWMELLGRAMAGDENLLDCVSIPAIRTHLIECGVLPCRCDN